MDNLTLKQIERRARLDHDGDFVKAAEAYFRDHPEEARAKVEASPDREAVEAMNEVAVRSEAICLRQGWDFRDPVQRAKAEAELFAKDPQLYKRCREASTVRVGKVSLR